MNSPEALFVLPRLRVHNANAISSHLTWGFPSPTAFTGFAHVLQRKLGAALDLSFNGVAIISHRCNPQVSQPNGRRYKTFNLTRNPVLADGSVAGIVEEGRVHLEVSLVVGVTGNGLYSGADPRELCAKVVDAVGSMRIAGGTIVPLTRPPNIRESAELVLWPGTAEEERLVSRKIARRLLPGFALVSRRNLLTESLAELRKSQPDATELDALLDASRLNIEPPEDPQNEWTVRKRSGWIVPIPLGYAAISPLFPPGAVRNTRDSETPFRFVESVLSLGQWISPHRVPDVRNLLWYESPLPDEGLYLCSTPYFDKQTQPGKGI